MPSHYLILLRGQKRGDKVTPKIGRPPKQSTPRNKSLNIRLTESELNMIEECAKRLDENRTNVIIQGVAMLLRELKKTTN